MMEVPYALRFWPIYGRNGVRDLYSSARMALWQWRTRRSVLRECKERGHQRFQIQVIGPDLNPAQTTTWRDIQKPPKPSREMRLMGCERCRKLWIEADGYTSSMTFAFQTLVLPREKLGA